MLKKHYLLLPTILAIGILTGCGGSATTQRAEETDQTETEEIATSEEQETENLIEQASDSMDAAELLTQWKTTQYFTDEPVAEDNIDQILAAGINTTSAMNEQPWHFSAVTDSELLQQIADGMSFGMLMANVNNAETSNEETKSVQKAGIADVPLAIVVSCKDGSELDAGLATQSMFIEARLLGYGAKIISSPTMVLNGDEKETYQELLGIPSDYSVAAVLLVGYEDTSIDASVEGVTGASVRNDEYYKVTFVVP
ncbi:MAG: nitroreductase family protein [Clostridiales bacterium]|nr:nitroreductase family protein [Clostridiales bacterium]